MFELAVTAVASIGVHLAGEGFDARFVTELGEVPRQGSFRDTLLDTLAVLQPSRATRLDAGIQALSSADGQLIAVLGELTAGQAQELAAARRGNAQALALILAEDERTVAASARALTGAGWRVAVVTEPARLPTAWQELHRGVARGGSTVPSTTVPSTTVPSTTVPSSTVPSSTVGSGTTVTGGA
jgi:hypothetical protein